jgi:hypothetical protein
MNISAIAPWTDSGPFRFRRWLLPCFAVYILYLIALGPFYALDGQGHLNFAPRRLLNAVYGPAAPFYWLMGPNNPYDDYLSLWYEDPNAAETTW